jgi:DNA-binding NtrC family response regulator
MAEGTKNRAFHELCPLPPAQRRGRILLVEDDPLVRDSIARTLLSAQHEVVGAADWKSALAQVGRERFDLLLAELKGSRSRGPDLLAEVRRVRPDLPVVLLTVFATTRGGLEAVRKGAYGFIQKPFDKEELLLLVDRALEQSRLKGQNRLLREAAALGDGPATLLGQSRPIQQLNERIDQALRLPGPIVVRGEPGSGRSLVARAIHTAGDARGGPCLTVNCASIPAPQLAGMLLDPPLEDAAPCTSHLSRLDQVGGAIVLDEAGLLPPELHQRLMRLFQSRSTADAPAPGSRSLRIIATVTCCSADDVEAVERAWERAGALFLDLPPLRDRSEDIPELCRHFLHRRSRRTGRPFRHVEPEAMRLLQKYRWPGNVRELRDLVERSDMAETEPCVVRAATIAGWLGDGQGVPRSSANGSALAADPLDRLPLAEVEKRVILDTLAKFEGHRAKTATALGIGIRTLGIKLKKWREDGALAELPYL